MRRKANFCRNVAFCVLLLLLTGLLAVPVFANDIYKVEIEAILHQDGSATIRESWHINMDNSSNTEFYVAKHNLDNMYIRGLHVEEVLEDGTVVPFETLNTWVMDASRQDKAGKCGTVRTKGGYEICWGFGELGEHHYIVTYTITNIVKGYDGGDIMSYNFLSDAAGGASSLDIRLRAEDFPMEYPDTRVWVFGYEAESDFVDGGIQILGNGRFRRSDYATVMLAFEPGLLSPSDHRDETAEEIIALNMEGSIWEDAEESESSGSNSVLKLFPSPLRSFGGLGFLMFSPAIWPLVLLLVFRAGRRGKGGGVSKSQVSRMKQNVEYCRELPFGGSLEATYARLHALGQAKEGSVIGCYMLNWVRTGQVEIVKEETGLIVKRQEDALRLNSAPAEMAGLERDLYEMLQAAAGSDLVLQSKEFQRWARKKYSKVGAWLSSVRIRGEREMEDMGAYHNIPVKRLFGLHETTQRAITPLGEEMTQKMFGFLRYLQDFTIINEREAREVELWDQYLIFAQLFDIADSVAKQFRQLYPDYFTGANTGGTYHRDVTDILVATAISASFSRSMHAGYRAGMSAASSRDSGSSYSGGGGSSSSTGGGGGSSGGGGAGGR